MATRRAGPPPVPPDKAPKPPVGLKPLPESSSRSSLLTDTTAQADKALAQTALALREEQIRAKVVYVGADQQTNEELDAITDAVVAELHALQAAGAAAVATVNTITGGYASVKDLERELAKSLQAMLDTLFSNRRKAFLKRKVDEIQRHITGLFFNSELYSKISAGSPEHVEVSWPDQAVYYALKRHETALIADLHLLKYTAPGVREEAITRLQRFEIELRMEFLSRTTPELETLLKIFRDTLKVFFRKFRRELYEFTTRVIIESGVAQGRQVGYKLTADAFPAFRTAFDRVFLEGLVNDVQHPLVEHAVEMTDKFRTDTVRFVADPRIFSEICAVFCDACYDYLYSEGYLDLPADWRTHFEARR